MSTSSEIRTVAVTGSSGLVGSALITKLVADGITVRRVVRGAATRASSDIQWDPTTGSLDKTQLAGVDAVVHLAGAGIADARWTEKRKRLIRNSRVLGTRLLAETLAALSSPPRVLVCASAVGYYGDRGDELLDENSPPGEGFLPQVCVEWEQAARPPADAGIRVVHLRIGVVLSRVGGALAQMLTPFRFGLGGVLGDGRQYMSWIALDDLIRIVQFALRNPDLAGPVNAVSPNPVTNRQFTRALGRTLRRPTVLPVPAFAVRAIFGEMGQRLLLEGQRVRPAKLESAGFTFTQPDIEGALRHELQ